MASARAPAADVDARAEDRDLGPTGTLAVGTTHALQIANVVSLSGPGITPDPTTMTFTVTTRKD